MNTVRNFFTDNVNSILGAVSIHLFVVIIFLLFKLGEVDKMQKEEVLIEFNEEMLPPAEKSQADESASEMGGDAVPSLDQQTLHSIASNVASKLDPKISTGEYEKQVLQELGISSLKSPGGEIEKSSEQLADENAIEQQAQQNKDEAEAHPNIIRKDNTTVSYFLEGRWHRYIYIPTYKCQGGGTVLIDIVINQSGKVISAIIQENKSTLDPCLREEAYHSAISAQFNTDPKATVKQIGTMAYVFLPQ